MSALITEIRAGVLRNPDSRRSFLASFTSSILDFFSDMVGLGGACAEDVGELLGGFRLVEL